MVSLEEMKLPRKTFCVDWVRMVVIYILNTSRYPGVVSAPGIVPEYLRTTAKVTRLLQTIRGVLGDTYRGQRDTMFEPYDPGP